MIQIDPMQSPLCTGLVRFDENIGARTLFVIVLILVSVLACTTRVTSPHACGDVCPQPVPLAASPLSPSLDINTTEEPS